jgi:hypothetical protein
MSMPAIPLFISSRWHEAWKRHSPMHIEDGMTVQQKAGENVAPIDFPGNFSPVAADFPSQKAR